MSFHRMPEAIHDFLIVQRVRANVKANLHGFLSMIILDGSLEVKKKLIINNDEVTFLN